MCIGGILYDVAKAFACMHHEMLDKLHFCGMQGVSEDQVRSCLTNRGQKVEVKSPNTTKIFFLYWV